MGVIFRDPARPLRQQLAFAVAKAVVVTFAFLAAHVSVSVATDLGALDSPGSAPDQTQVVVDVEQAVVELR